MGQPNALVTIVQCAFIAFSIVLFRAVGPARAVTPTLLGGWIFLPHFDARSTFLGLPSKATFVPAIVLLMCVLFDDVRRWQHLRPRLIDVPVALAGFGPFLTAIHNGLGAREALAATLEAVLTWGTPYLLGRVYLGCPWRLKDFASDLVGAALLYVPLCLWEIRMSPQLQFQLYGFRAENFTTIIRYGGFRPSVFMQSGLAVGLFMALGALSAYWLWRTDVCRKVLGVPILATCMLLTTTTILCKSMGAILLAAVGVLALEAMRRGRTALVIAFATLAAAPPTYCAARIAGWDAQVLVDLTRQTLDEERASSLQARVHNEQLLIEKAMLRPWLGWGRFGRSFVYDEEGQNLGVVVDSLWIIALGFSGLIGLACIGWILLFPPLLSLRAFGTLRWSDPRLAPAAILITTNLLWTADDLLNAMVSPMFPAAAGALVSFAMAARTAGAQSRRAPRYVPASPDRRRAAGEAPISR